MKNILYLSFLSVIAAYYYCIHTFEIPQIWLDRQHQKSGDPGLFTLPNSSFIQSGALAMPYGVYLAIFYRAFFQKDREYEKMCERQETVPIAKGMLRVAIVAILICGAYGPYMIFMGLNNIYEALILTTLLPLGFICFVVPAYQEDLYYQFGISWYKLKEVEDKAVADGPSDRKQKIGKKAQRR